MTNAEPIRPLVATANYSYASRRYTGDGYILIGDAAAFIDPLFSSGVMMAMSSAAFAAEVVDAWLDNRELGRRLMRDYECRVRRALHSLSWLIYRINTPVLRDIFMASFDLFDTRNGLLAILAGDFYAAPGLLSPLRRLQLAYGCLYLLSKLGFHLRVAGLVWAATAWSGELSRRYDGFSTRSQRLCHDRGSGRSKIRTLNAATKTPLVTNDNNVLAQERVVAKGVGSADGTVEMRVLQGISVPDCKIALSDVAAFSLSLRLISTPRFRKIFWAKMASVSDISGRIRSPA
jgi:hypothetical protein